MSPFFSPYPILLFYKDIAETVNFGPKYAFIKVQFFNDVN